MVSRLFGAMPLFELMLTCCKLEQTYVEFELQYKTSIHGNEFGNVHQMTPSLSRHQCANPSLS